MGKVIDDTIVEVTNKIVEALKGTDYVFEGKWSTEAWDSEGGQNELTDEDPVTKQITLYPIITKKTEEQVTIYSNIDDSKAVVELSRKDGKVTFPEEEALPEGIVKEGSKGIIDTEPVTTEFVGYSLVFIVNSQDGTEVSRVSDALYAPGDTIEADEITAYTGKEDEKHQIARIYAVWTQIQTISDATIYNGNAHKTGYFTVAAINTEILANAGLQKINATGSAASCSYGRYFEYIKDSQAEYKLTSDCGKEIWDNDLYAEYFSTDALPKGWNIFGSILSNLNEKFYDSRLSTQPYIVFTYHDKETKRINGEIYESTYSEALRN